jgi:hypothetical protein
MIRGRTPEPDRGAQRARSAGGPFGLRTSLFKGRQKYKNLVAHPQVTLFVIDPANPYRTLEIRAVAEVTDDPDLAFLQRLLTLYGSDLESLRGPQEDRVVITLRPPRR